MWFEIKFKLNALKLEGFNLSDSKFRESILIDSKFGDNFDDSSWEDLSCVTLYYIQLYTQVYAQMWPIITMSHNILILFSSLPLPLPLLFRHHVVQHCKITRFEHNCRVYTSIETERWRESRNRRQKVNVLCVHVEAQWRFSLMRPFNDGNERLATAFETTPDARVGYRC